MNLAHYSDVNGAQKSAIEYAVWPIAPKKY